ncbi:MAG: hypothetical protein ACR2QB_01800 [Gammaproteobacteria bacterium]
MNWTALSAFSDILAAIAVIGTLIYLARQIRESTESQLRGMRNRHEDAVSSDLIGSSDLSRIQTQIKNVDGHTRTVEALVQRYDLSYEDANRWVHFLLRLWQRMHTDYKFGVSNDIGIRAAFYYPDQAIFWDHAKWAFDEEFVKHVDKLRPKKGFFSEAHSTEQANTLVPDTAL